MFEDIKAPSRVSKFENALVWTGENGTFETLTDVHLRMCAHDLRQRLSVDEEHFIRFRYRINVDEEHFLRFQIYPD